MLDEALVGGDESRSSGLELEPEEAESEAGRTS